MHLIAIVNQTLSAIYLQRLCQHLSIRASIHSSFDKAARQQVANTLPTASHTHFTIGL
ncbi:hypothetical protein [Psychrobacter frigidicola]|uniref:hypothetical protein n=1 Tax=Psychrobacter frigidicola TaxID=45611 RepID=UPI0019188874|nr:hypothetical protein [Psychrobacter frigidicola]